MATNEEIEKQVGPKTFTRNPYSVTIAADGKIHVHKDDWLSKYSWALYGDYDTIDENIFVRGNPEITSAIQKIEGIKKIDNVDEIRTGEYLIHVPTYFHWMEKNGNPQPKKPKKEEEKKPNQVRSDRWMAANLGGIDGTLFVGAAGATKLTFRNLDVNQDFHFILLRGGIGLGLDLGDIKGIKNLIRAILSMADFAKDAATANFVPVETYLPFSADSAQGYDISCYSWEVNSGVGGMPNLSYDKITGYTPRDTYFQVVFEQSDWIEMPGIGVSFTGGALIWIW